jgi:hypothetical protein
VEKEIKVNSRNLTDEQTRYIAKMFFQTKRETAEHYPMYFYIYDQNSWWAPRDGKRHEELLKALKGAIE